MLEDCFVFRNFVWRSGFAMGSNIGRAGHKLSRYRTDTTGYQVRVRKMTNADGRVESIVHHVDEMIAKGGQKMKKRMSFSQIDK
ncbi:hypothetical protein LMG27952_05447 [Paraburkholderia hiiakae]|uniref:Uncharacterized protein n=1 Tax=Paraburkholderia hiiakae TaxID=1081782 RepID=A0ABN7I9F9_9BURK|nr:hypothetical protein LMG27952_05447 [Paraburkholderia hiiakae]